MNINPQIFKCKSIKEARYKAVDLIMKKGKYGADERGEQVKYYKHIIIIVPSWTYEENEDVLTFLCGAAFAQNLITGKATGEGIQSHEYTYGEELHEDNGLERTIQKLIEHPETRRAVNPLFKVKHIGKKEVPCMITLVWDIEEDEEEDEDFLNLTVLGRSNEIAIAMKSDLKGFQELVKYVATRINKAPGSILLHDVNAHCRVHSDMDEIKKILKEGY